MNELNVKLNVQNHDRYSHGARYVYPVVSRRAQGVSVGINLNPNNACNFRCIYCQVPGLSFGKGPSVDVPLLEQELHALLDEIVHGTFLQTRVPSGSQRLNDIALSGNGEPTSSPAFGECVEVIGRALRHFSLQGAIKVVLITNGSLTHKPEIEAALGRMRELGGEVWFKLDRTTQAGAALVNDSAASVAERLARLRRVAEVCPTWIQTCWFGLDGAPPSPGEESAYVGTIAELWRDQVPLLGVQLYGLARESQQPEAPRLSRLPEALMEAFAARLRAVGADVRVSA
jgi:Radical SAM superfamily